MKYIIAKSKIDKLAKENYSNFYSCLEYEAAVTHWLQSPQLEYPFFPENFLDDCLKLFCRKTKKNQNKKLISEEDALYQPLLSFGYNDIPFPPPKDPKFTFIDLFAGIGGIRIPFQKLEGKCVFSSEWDKHAQKTYETNFGEVPFGDINSIDADQVPDHNILLAGFPCQAFSVAGYRQGFKDKKGRGNLFFKIEDILKTKKPDAFLLENVKNLENHDRGRTFSIIKERLKQAGYEISYKVLNSMHYGNIPQSRERIYIVGIIKDKNKSFDFEKINKMDLTVPIRDFIDLNVDYKYYYKRFDCYQQLVDEVKSCNTLYQWRRKYVRENKSNVCPTLTANMGTGGHNVPLILDGNPKNIKYGNIRKLTPRECLRFQGFSDDYILPNFMSDSHLYKQIGNSVTLPVVERIAQELISLLT